MLEFFNSIPPWVVQWIIFPLAIILARTCDVALGTMKIILIGKGQKIAPIIGAIEMLIWIFVVSQIIQNLDKVQYYFAFAIGYGCGVFIGMKIENRISLGQVVIRVITNNQSAELFNILKDNNLNYTTYNAEGKFGPVRIILIVAQRHFLSQTLKLIESTGIANFYSIEDLRYVKGTLPGGKNNILRRLNPFVKS